MSGPLIALFAVSDLLMLIALRVIFCSEDEAGITPACLILLINAVLALGCWAAFGINTLFPL